MKPATRKKLIQALQKRVQEILGDKLPADLRAARRAIRADVSSKGQVSAEHMFRTGVAIGIWSEAERVLKAKPEPTPEQLDKFLSDIEEVEIASLLRASLKNMWRKLPPFPPGKQPSLTLQKQRQALAEVRRLTASGSLNLKAAYAQVAKKHGVHWRTIENACIRIRKQTSKGEMK